MEINSKVTVETFVIRSVRNDGSKFRPGDWIERISATLASFNTSPVTDHSSKGAKPCVIDGEKCLVVESQLATVNPAAYEFIMSFAYSNDLRIQQDRRSKSRNVSVERRSHEGQS
ncbi:hypothetical protein MNBD_GAMMA22-26 [hydrothermal vent metagenome]|uniref:DUF3579 domain-containing protein n=1 Tax=hydrothermal vent metagenome TaxID=652676 RepID=A0A3B1A5A4_9ZZZZ